MSRLSRRAGATLLALSLAVHDSVPLFAATPAEPITRGDYDSCQSRDEPAFRAAIEAITIKALKSSVANFDYKASVNEAWRTGGLDAVIDAEVDKAVGGVGAETSLLDKGRSLFDKDKSKALAQTVAERVFNAPATKSAVESLAVAVGRDISKRIELASQDAAEPALNCLKAFLGPRYGDQVARAVTADAARDFGLDPKKASAEIGTGAVLSQSREGIAGAAILLVRGQLANMAERVGARLVGSVLSRLVSLVAGGVGLVLIAKDLWDLSGGVLPIVASEMKSDATRDKVRDEIARAMSDQIGEHLRDIGVKSADHVVEIWQSFRAAHAKALDLADHNDAFKSFLDTVKPGALARLDEAVALILRADGEDGLLKRLKDGSLEQAVNTAPDGAFTIARETGSLDGGLKWAALAGPDLAKVVDLGLYKRAKPEDISRGALTRLLGLDTPLSITRLAALARESRDVLLDLDDTNLRTLAKALTESDLDQLARYMTGLAKEPRDRVLRAVAANPAVMARFASSSVRGAIVSSRDQGEAVDMMLRADTGIDTKAMIEDARSAFEGRISPLLVWDRHPTATLASLAVPVLLLLFLMRLLRPRRPRPNAVKT